MSAVEQPCPKCKNPLALMTAWQRYFHLFWIPTIPYKKELLFECAECGHAFTDRDVPSKQFKKMVKTPFYMFTGLVLVLLGLGYIAYDTVQADRLVQEFKVSPKSNTVLVVQFPEEELPYLVVYVAAEESGVFTVHQGKYFYSNYTSASKEAFKIKEALKRGDSKYLEKHLFEEEHLSAAELSVLEIQSVN
jgi:hypothetical protein